MPEPLTCWTILTIAALALLSLAISLLRRRWREKALAATSDYFNRRLTAALQGEDREAVERPTFLRAPLQLSGPSENQPRV